MSLLLVVEHDNQTMSSSVLNLITAAKALTEHVTLLVAGKNCQAVAQAASECEGVETVFCVDDPTFEHFLAEPLAEAIESFAKDFDYILAPASTFGKNVLPRVAASLDVTQISDVTGIQDKNTFEHPIYAGNAIETVRVLDKKICLTVRPTAFKAVGTQSPCPIVPKTVSSTWTKTQFISHELSESSRPDLLSANVIVSGGRGLQTAEKFKLVDDLADVLGAAVGASRAAVDAGFVPNDCQVGQTGKVVAPKLYIALGISGAIQHLAGMKDSSVIVAINKDEEAPIFQIATYGLVGDLFVLVPELIEKLRR